MKTSKFMRIDWRDALNSFFLAFMSFLCLWLQETFIPQLNISMELKIFLITGITALGRKFFRNSKTIYSEDIGLPKEILEICEDVVYIPQYGSVRSLNVGTASGIVMNKFAEKWTMKEGLK